ncbi:MULTISPECIES: carbohydrate ABC transporter permease [Streptomyces]|uniref:Transport system inner membrane protein n=1 Tax=Streptomyces albus (strain ATCC 21838 / DSM 41398 / FERM P-419 / JCM 4703 / NBRC 107858) TaxID=1081613 RepID=A0A0B5EUL9_STRA4|nr:sugar ABC transporter permease [Streptomyces sp. SCSIO ZS0520]AJE86543.1 transport system inner membrane protein [Streptomyces albus]AOU80847.1 transport system inner membrane protein [Streptomyces albus]AYN36550.1 sugar ABC transporter permease [Streptomyces albus]
MTSLGTVPDTAARRPARAARERRRLSRKHREWLAAALFLAPDCIGLLLFVGIPMLLSIFLGFFQVSGFGSYRWVGLGNYERMMSDPLFWDAMRITAIYVVVLVPVLFAVSLGLGLLVKQKLPAVGAFRTALFLPYVISLVVVGLLWKFLLDDQVGAVSGAIEDAGLGHHSWLGEPSLALASLIAVTVWVMMGYYMVIFLAGLQEIPQEYYEAAKIDGAGPWRTFRSITWPLLRPTSFFVLLMSTVAALTGGLDLIFVLTSGGPANGTSLAIFYIYQQAFIFGEYGYASALGSFLVLIMVLVSAVVFRVTRGGRFDDGE